MFRVHVPALALAFSILMAGVTTVSAQGLAVDPEDLAITPSDLPPGFTYDPAATSTQALNEDASIGMGYKLALERDPTPENRASGPVVVSQVIFRVDRLLNPQDFFTEIRDHVAREQDLQPVPGAPSSPTLSVLMKREERQGEMVVLYGVGSVQDKFVFFTFVGGADSATPLDGAMQIAQISTDRYEALKTAPPPVQAEHLYRALLKSPFVAPQLTNAFGNPQLASGEPGDRAMSHGVIGEVDVDFTDGSTIGYITYLVYPSEVEAQAAFDVARSGPPGRATVIGEFTPSDVSVPFYCVNSIGVVDGRPMGASTCLAVSGNVEVGAFTALPSATAGDEAGTGELLRSGLQHLQRLRR